MKKIILPALLFFVTFSLFGQTKITKASIVGKWVISAVEMKGMFYYCVENDSLGFGDMIKAQVADTSQLKAVTGMIKPQLTVFTKMAFIFNLDGTAELENGIDSAQVASYTVDEENSTITTTDKDKKEDTMKAEMLIEKLKISVKQPEGEILMLLKKVKR